MDARVATNRSGLDTGKLALSGSVSTVRKHNSFTRPEISIPTRLTVLIVAAVIVVIVLFLPGLIGMDDLDFKRLFAPPAPNVGATKQASALQAATMTAEAFLAIPTAMPTATSTPTSEPTPTATVAATPTFTPTFTPEPTATPAPTATPEPVTYVVKSGDNLSRIASDFGVTVDAIAQANNIENPSRISVGMVLIIPGATPPAPETEATAAPETEATTAAPETEATTTVTPQ